MNTSPNHRGPASDSNPARRYRLPTCTACGDTLIPLELEKVDVHGRCFLCQAEVPK